MRKCCPVHSTHAPSPGTHSLCAEIRSSDGLFRQPPQFNTLVPTASGQVFTVRGISQAQHLAAMTPAAAGLPGGCVPEFDGTRAIPVAVATGQRFAIGGEGHAPDVALMSLERCP